MTDGTYARVVGFLRYRAACYSHDHAYELADRYREAVEYIEHLRIELMARSTLLDCDTPNMEADEP